MKNRFVFHLLVAMAVSCHIVSCDEGDIRPNIIRYNQNGRTVCLSGKMAGLDAWSSKFSLRIASFNNESDYAILSKVVTADRDGNVDLMLTGISDDATRVDLCVLDRLRQKVFTIAETDITAVSDTAYMDVGVVDASMFGIMQTQIFDKLCVGCHRDGTNPSGQLTLTAGNSYAALVGRHSYKYEDRILVRPGDAPSSVLYRLLISNPEEWHMPHADIVKETSAKEYVREWISGGATPPAACQ